MHDKLELEAAVRTEEASLARLHRQAAEVADRLSTLRQQLAQVSAQVALPAPPPRSVPTSNAEKLALFRRLFRGRIDVFPRLWLSAKTGRKGYTPACANEWLADVCDKPRIKCSACGNRSLMPVTDQVLLDHLQGRHVVGVYPLLPDETCWFLAADFDGAAWRDDVRAFAEAGRRVGLPVAIERSRSGDGGHAWLFCAEPVPAQVAR